MLLPAETETETDRQMWAESSGAGLVPPLPHPTLLRSQPQQYLSGALQATMDGLRDDLLHTLPEPGQYRATGAAEDRGAGPASTSQSTTEELR